MLHASLRTCCVRRRDTFQGRPIKKNTHTHTHVRTLSHHALVFVEGGKTLGGESATRIFEIPLNSCSRDDSLLSFMDPRITRHRSIVLSWSRDQCFIQMEHTSKQQRRSFSFCVEGTCSSHEGDAHKRMVPREACCFCARVLIRIGSLGGLVFEENPSVTPRTLLKKKGSLGSLVPCSWGRSASTRGNILVENGSLGALVCLLKAISYHTNDLFLKS